MNELCIYMTTEKLKKNYLKKNNDAQKHKI